MQIIINEDIVQIVKQYHPNKKFTCTTCNKSYTYKHGLERHKNYRCGQEKHFQCVFCPHRAHLKYNLISHIITVHNVTREYIKEHYP